MKTPPPDTAGELLAFILRSFFEEYKQASNENKSDTKRGTAPSVRRDGKGLLPPIIIAEAASDLLEDCHFCGYPPGPQLTALLQELLKVDRPRLRRDREYNARDRAAWILAQDPPISNRQIAKLAGTSHTSISGWRSDKRFLADVEEKRKLIAIMQEKGMWRAKGENSPGK